MVGRHTRLPVEGYLIMAMVLLITLSATKLELEKIALLETSQNVWMMFII